MRTVFLGTPELAVPSLAALAAKHEVAAVVCQPDRPAGRNRKPAPPPVKQWAQAHGIPVHQPRKLNDGRFAEWLRDQGPEVCAIAAYGRLLKQPILDIPPHGFINMHPSLLPRHRGPSPIQTAVLEGDAVTGVTIMRLILEMDAGDIILQEEAPIHDNDTTGTLAARLAELGGRMLAQAVDRIEAGTATFTPQDHGKATYTRMFQKEDGRIRWTEPAWRIQNLIRASNPWPVAHCCFRGQVCRIHRATTPGGDGAGSETAAPGKILACAKDGIAVATGEGRLLLQELQMPGKKVLGAAEFIRGQRVEPGARFEEV